jgi:uncharacterized protein
MRPLLFLPAFLKFLRHPRPAFRQVPLSLRVVAGLFVSLSLLRLGTLLADVWLLRPLIRLLTNHDLARQVLFSNDSREIFLGAVVVAPLLEELAYRWGLRYSPRRTAVYIALVVFYWLPLGGTYATNLLSVLRQPGFYLMVGAAAATGLTVYALLKVPLLEVPFRRGWRRHFGGIYYASSLLFAFMHIFNVKELTPEVVLLVPLVTIQQVVFGFFNGFVRVRFGFWHAVIQHALFNLVPLLLILYAQQTI